MSSRPSRDELVGKYYTDRFSLGEIASQYNRSLTTIRVWFNSYQILRRTSAESSRISKGLDLIGEEFSKKEKSVLYGSLLGDGHLQRRGPSPTARFSETHCLEQFSYLQWKTDQLLRLNAKCSIFKPDKSSFSKSNMCRMHTSILPCLEGIRQKFYNEKVKTISKEILEELDPLALAIWYQDDGYREPNGYHSELSTSSFSIEENNLFVHYFKENWNINCTIVFKTVKGKKHPALYFQSKEANRLLTIIEPHMHSVFRYKWFNHRKDV